MKNEKKYEALKQFFLENFETTSNIKDRLHTRDILNVAYNNKFLFSDCRVAEVFKSLKIGEHRKSCNINKNSQSGYYYIIYKGSSKA